MPYIAPFTGAEFLRDAEWSNVINLRASYNQETEEMVARLTEDMGIKRIAVLFQDDSFGRAGYRGVRAALDRRKMMPVAIGLYPRNTLAVKMALLDINDGDPKAVILIGAYKPLATFISWARFSGLQAVFMNISFVGSNALAKELGSAGAGVYVTQVVPFPTDRSRPIVRDYHRALSAYASGVVPGFISFEGYLAGRMAIAGLKKSGGEISRAGFLDGFRQAGMIDLGGFRLRFGNQDNQGSDAVYLTVIGRDGQYRPISSMLEAAP